MGFKTNFRSILLGAGNQVIDTMNIEAARDADQTRQGIAEANRQWNATLATNKQGYENYTEFLSFIKSHPEQFTGNWDRRLAALYQDQPSLFKGESFNAIKETVAKALSTYKIQEEKLGEGVDSPYVSAADYFNANQDNIRNHIGNISGMNNVVNLMTAEKEFAKGTTDLSGFEQLEGTLDKNITTATMTAYGYGILRQEPTNVYNQKLLEIEKLRIIAANAQNYTTQESKSKFLAEAINKNVIDLASIYMFNKPITGKLLLDLFQTELANESAIVEKALTHFRQLETGLANEDPNVTPEMVDSARTDYENKRNEMYGKVNQHIYSTIGQTIPFDVGQVEVKEEPEKIEEPQKLEVPEGYKPKINSAGDINLIDGSKVSIEEILQNKEEYSKTQPPEVMEYINQFAPLFDEDGEMLRPTREMFAAGKIGDKLFKKFMRIYMGLNFTEFLPVGPYKKEDVDQEPLMDKLKKLIQFEISEQELKKIKPKKTKKYKNIIEEAKEINKKLKEK